MTYPSAYETEGPYWGDLTTGPPCPVCGAPRGQCPDGAGAAPLVYPPLDLPEPLPQDRGAPVRLYRVTVRGYETVLRLSDADAAAYGDAATPIP